VRRLAQHALAGAGFAAVVTAISVAGLTSPAADDVATAVPAVSSVQSPDASVAAACGDAELRLAVQRARRNDVAAVKAERARAKAAKQAAKRSSWLKNRTKSISAEHVNLVAAAKKAAAEAAERKRAMANRGYLPGTTDPREIARQILKNKYGYGESDFDCFNNIIIRESMWDIDATNPSSGAYGIPQALPGSKMATVGSDWRTNPATQITWAIGYMEDRYGSPCAAWSFKRAHGWY
jgi:Transglycosylase SLT domain